MLKNRIKNDSGFMGYTHALSAVAIFLMLGALVPKVLFNDFLGTRDILIFIVAILVTAGGALLPDLDNTKSTAISTLGPLGVVLSKLMRASATVVHSVVRTRRDENVSNPHRLLWHTLVSVLFVWLIVLSMININIPIDIFGEGKSLGFIFALMWIYCAVKMSIAGLMPKMKKKFKRYGFIGFIVGEIIALAVTVSTLFSSIGVNDFSWVAHCLALGYLIHILGDSMTTAGVPLVWPFKIKGKMWWNISFLRIKAGGTVENFVFVPIFTVIILGSIFKIWFL